MMTVDGTCAPGDGRAGSLQAMACHAPDGAGVLSDIERSASIVRKRIA
jgi:hypothetical protein